MRVRDQRPCQPRAPGCRDRPEAIVRAASNIVGNRLLWIRRRRVMASMCLFSQATSVNWCGSSLERQRKERPNKREQQQQSGGQVLHAFPVIRTRSEASIEHVCGRVQAGRLAFAAANPILYSHLASMNQALPLIFAHHQRTPTNRNRQSWKNSGGLPSKMWPTNCKIQPATKRTAAKVHSR